MSIIPVVGRRYVCRNGEVTGPLIKDTRFLWDPVFKFYYDSNELGWRVCPDTETDNDYDLMSEYNEGEV